MAVFRPGSRRNPIELGERYALERGGRQVVRPGEAPQTVIVEPGVKQIGLSPQQASEYQRVSERFKGSEAFLGALASGEPVNEGQARAFAGLVDANWLDVQANPGRFQRVAQYMRPQDEGGLALSGQSARKLVEAQENGDSGLVREVFRAVLPEIEAGSGARSRTYDELQTPIMVKSADGPTVAGDPVRERVLEATEGQIRQLGRRETGDAYAMGGYQGKTGGRRNNLKGVGDGEEGDPLGGVRLLVVPRDSGSDRGVPVRQIPRMTREWYDAQTAAGRRAFGGATEEERVAGRRELAALQANPQFELNERGNARRTEVIRRDAMFPIEVFAGQPLPEKFGFFVSEPLREKSVTGSYESVGGERPDVLMSGEQGLPFNEHPGVQRTSRPATFAEAVQEILSNPIRRGDGSMAPAQTPVLALRLGGEETGGRVPAWEDVQWDPTPGALNPTVVKVGVGPSGREMYQRVVPRETVLEGGRRGFVPELGEEVFPLPNRGAQRADEGGRPVLYQDFRVGSNSRYTPEAYQALNDFVTDVMRHYGFEAPEGYALVANTPVRYDRGVNALQRAVAGLPARSGASVRGEWPAEAVTRVGAMEAVDDPYGNALHALLNQIQATPRLVPEVEGGAIGPVMTGRNEAAQRELYQEVLPALAGLQKRENAQITAAPGMWLGMAGNDEVPLSTRMRAPATGAAGAEAPVVAGIPLTEEFLAALPPNARAMVAQGGRHAEMWLKNFGGQYASAIAPAAPAGAVAGSLPVSETALGRWMRNPDSVSLAERTAIEEAIAPIVQQRRQEAYQRLDRPETWPRGAAIEPEAPYEGSRGYAAREPVNPRPPAVQRPAGYGSRLATMDVSNAEPLSYSGAEPLTPEQRLLRELMTARAVAQQRELAALPEKLEAVKQELARREALAAMEQVAQVDPEQRLQVQLQRQVEGELVRRIQERNQRYGELAGRTWRAE